MIKYVYASDLHKHPKLAASMFRDRTAQFRDRLNWDVSVNDEGLERDEYDDLNPLYVIYELEDGTHGGSMRLAPTTGKTMLKDHFVELMGGVEIESASIWEVTRFTASQRLVGNPRKSARISAALMLAGCEIALKAGIEFYVGVFDPRMKRIYRQIGWSPEVLGESDCGEIFCGLWEVTEEVRATVEGKAYPSGRTIQPASFEAEHMLLAA